MSEMEIFVLTRKMFAPALVAVALGLPATALADSDSGGTAPAPSSSSRQTFSAALKMGSRGPAVEHVQRRLRLEADGVYGSATKRAVKRFQRRRELTADGIVGRATGAALGLRWVERARVGNADERRVLAAIAKCESSGNPTAVSADGRYRGKYQFLRSTWRRLGGKGDPAAAPEREQDRRALKLLRAEGTSPWGACGARAR